ncbi:nitrogen fixation protein NifZ [Vibrio salinus]|uniref:nitrogen fixation protein NifZ n=1 Tax=Vibrio salinus TaxID=2899784 RepID=UPI001E496EF9|nr:nitrogen fixation protein NifZ [Vibrio salinus]MCE0495427.1 nitrogen fixation protein NifZ [Vibrio salinus]
MEGTGKVRFESGEEVRVIRNVRNDGSFTELDKGGLLVEAGSLGIVRTYGYFLQTQIIFQIFFPDVNRVIGIRDTELIPAGVPWIPRMFNAFDKAKLTRSLAMDGEIIAQKGDIVEIQRSLRDLENGALKYEVELASLRFQLDAGVFVQPECQA